MSKNIQNPTVVLESRGAKRSRLIKEIAQARADMCAAQVRSSQLKLQLAQVKADWVGAQQRIMSCKRELATLPVQ